MKFEIKRLKDGGYYLCEQSHRFLIILGDITLCKENYKNSQY